MTGQPLRLRSFSRGQKTSRRSMRISRRSNSLRERSSQELVQLVKPNLDEIHQSKRKLNLRLLVKRKSRRQLLRDSLRTWTQVQVMLRPAPNLSRLLTSPRVNPRPRLLVLPTSPPQGNLSRRTSGGSKELAGRNSARSRQMRSPLSSCEHANAHYI